MRRLYGVAILVGSFTSIAGACGGPAGDTPDTGVVEPDTGVAEPDAPDAAPALTVVELTAVDADYVAYRDGALPWKPATALGDDRYAFEVGTDYQVLVGCDHATHPRAWVIAATVEDDAPAGITCAVEPVPPPPVLVEVTLHVAQAGSVFLGGDVASSTSASWDAVLQVPVGTHDLVALSNNRIVVQRDLEITGATTLPDLDQSATGVVMESVPLGSITTSGGEVSDFSIALELAHGTAKIPMQWPNFRVPPASVLVASDELYVDVRITWETLRRNARLRYGDATLDFDMIEWPLSISFDEDEPWQHATFTSIPADVNVGYTMTQPIAGGTRTIDAFATARWLAATGARSVGYADLLPDFPVDPIDLDAPFTRVARMTHTITPIRYWNEWIVEVNAD